MPIIDQDHPDELDKREFSLRRKGFDREEVRAYLRKVDGQYRDLSLRAQDSKVRLDQAEYELGKLKAEQSQSVDTAIAAVLDAKDRILERARKQAAQIEEEARQNAEFAGDASGEPGELIEKARIQAASIVSEAEAKAEKLGHSGETDSVALVTMMNERDALARELKELTASAAASAGGDAFAIAAAEVKAKEIISSAEAAAKSMSDRLHKELASASSSNAEAEQRAETIIADAEERAKDLIALAQEVSGSSRSEAERIAATAGTAVLEEAHQEADAVKREAETLLKNAESASEARSAEIMLREAELEQLADMASKAEAEAAETLASARQSAEALRVEAQEFRDEASTKRDEADELLARARASAAETGAELHDSRDELEKSLKAIEETIAVKRAEVAEAEDSVAELAKHLESVRIELETEQNALMAAKVAAEAEAAVLVDAEERAAAIAEEAEERAILVTRDAEERAAELVAEAEGKAVELLAEAEAKRDELNELAATQAATSDAVETVISETEAKAEAILERARAEAERIETDAAEVLRNAVEARDQASTSSDDPEAAVALVAELEERELAVTRRERAISDREDVAEQTTTRGVETVAALYSVPAAAGTGTDGWPTGGTSAGSDSIDAIRREAMAALEHTRTQDGWAATQVASADTPRPVIDYSPSVPPKPKKVDVGDDEDDETAFVESRYRRNSAKLPRIGVSAASAAGAIANLRKQMTSDE
ncbi:MAG: DivIVA domain-containing protein [Actinomycetota bacterium]|nr:DivIVA domain-containing protein [Actinomycetota bacterium]